MCVIKVLPAVNKIPRDFKVLFKEPFFSAAGFKDLVSRHGLSVGGVSPRSIHAS